MTEDLLVRTDGPAAVVTLNRPHKRNAITLAIWQALPALAARLDADPDVRAVIVRGAGEQAFSAGADIEEFEKIYATPAVARASNDLIRTGLQAITDLGKPVIAAIHGACVGGGCGLALACDLRFAGASARFGITPAKLGLAYSFADTKLLVDKVGAARAKDILFSGRLLPAEEALAIGLVDRIAPDAELDQAVQAYADGLCRVSRTSIRIAKAMVNGVTAGLDRAQPELERMFDESFTSADRREGYRAFIEKRDPDFS